MSLAFIPPCVPKLTRSIPTGDAWEHEPKLDGFRLQVVKDRGCVRLFTRHGADWTRRLQTVAEVLRAIPAQYAILDCELVYLAPSGQPQFEPLMFGGDRIVDGLNAFAFDLLHLNGKDLVDLPQYVRRKRLVKLFEAGAVPQLHLTAAFEDGQALFEAAEHLGIEGIVSKRRDAPYHSGPSADWLKRKTESWRRSHAERWRLFARR